MYPSSIKRKVLILTFRADGCTWTMTDFDFAQCAKKTVQYVFPANLLSAFSVTRNARGRKVTSLFVIKIPHYCYKLKPSTRKKVLVKSPALFNFIMYSRFPLYLVSCSPTLQLKLTSASVNSRTLICAEKLF